MGLFARADIRTTLALDPPAQTQSSQHACISQYDTSAILSDLEFLLQVHALLRTNFACSLPRRLPENGRAHSTSAHIGTGTTVASGNPRPGSGRFTLNQIYSLLFEAVAC